MLLGQLLGSECQHRDELSFTLLVVLLQTRHIIYQSKYDVSLPLPLFLERYAFKEKGLHALQFRQHVS